MRAPTRLSAVAHGQGIASAPESTLPADGAAAAAGSPPNAADSASHSAVAHGQGSNASVPESTLPADGAAAAAGSPPDATDSASHSAVAHGQGSKVGIYIGTRKKVVVGRVGAGGQSGAAGVGGLTRVRRPAVGDT
eukprot:COSAG02_NODE_16_length_56207_cov_9.816122_28_plen_136_part_00